MRNEKIRKITVDAMFLAIMTIMTFVPYIGFIPLGAISITLMHVIVLVGAAYGGTLRGLLYGFFFGILSLLKAVISPAGILDPYFVNPLVSVLPRMIFGLLAGITFDLLFKLKSNTAKALLMPISSFVLTMIHSVITLTMLGLFTGSSIEMDGQTISYWAGIMGATLSTSSLLEAALAFVMVLPVSIAIVPRAISLQNQRDVSQTLGIVGCSFVWLPIVTWVVSGLGYQQSKAFENAKAKKMNFWALIASFIVFALALVISMIIQLV